jgi:uncharacterized protein YaaQ
VAKGDPRTLSASSGGFLKLSDKAMDGEERRMFEEMLKSMVVYHSEERITAEQVVARLPETSRVINGYVSPPIHVRSSPSVAVAVSVMQSPSLLQR